MVRLATIEIETLVNASHRCFGETARIWVFGSRADNTKRGGDIDLYIETDMKTNIVPAKLAMRSLIWKVFGEQKIDIVVRSRHADLSPLQKIAKKTGVEL